MKESKKLKLKLVHAACLILTVCMLLVSCGGATAMTLDDTSISANIYYYWLSQYKGYFLESFSGASDTAGFWKSEIADGVVMEDYLRDIADTNIKKNLAGLWLYDKLGLSVSDSQIDSVDADLADLVDSYGSKAMLNQELANYHINYNILRDIYVMQEKLSALEDYFIGENGVMLPSDEQLDSYYRDHYTRIKYISLNLFHSETDSSGTTQTIDMTAEEKEEIKELAESLAAEIRAGGDIDKLIAEHSDEDMSAYKNGVYIPDTITGYDLIDFAIAMDIGVAEVIAMSKCVYVVKRLELEDKPYTKDEMNQFADLVYNCSFEQYQEMLKSYTANIDVNSQIADEYTLSSIYY